MAGHFFQLMSLSDYKRFPINFASIHVSTPPFVISFSSVFASFACRVLFSSSSYCFLHTFDDFFVCGEPGEVTCLYMFAVKCYPCCCVDDIPLLCASGSFGGSGLCMVALNSRALMQYQYLLLFHLQPLFLL